MLFAITNVGSINGQRNLQGSTTSLSSAMERLSSGAKVNGAKDDAAGLAIASGITSQVRGMSVAVRNAYDGISLLQTAEGAISSLGDTLQRMRDLAVQSASSGSVSTSEREKIQAEFGALSDELVRVVHNSEFNGKKILNGDLEGGLSVQIGATTDANSRIKVSISNMTIALEPVTRSGLSPKTNAMDATFSAAIAEAATTAANDAQLLAANDSAKLAKAAVVAAKLAAASPNDLDLAKAASVANSAAATAIFSVSSNVLATANTNKAAGLVADHFLNLTTAANTASGEAVTAISATATVIQGLTETDSNQAASLLTAATQLAVSAEEQVKFAGQNVYASTMNSLTGDTLDVTDSSVTQSASALNASIARAEQKTFSADRNTQKTLAAADIAKAIVGASFVDDVTKTQAANENDKLSFINNAALLNDTSRRIDNISVDYALSAINAIDDAIDLLNAARANLGSIQNPFTTAISNLQNGIENQSAAKSRIMDADYAQETANLSRSQILQQAGTAMLAQANQSSQSVVTLLK